MIIQHNKNQKKIEIGGGFLFVGFFMSLISYNFGLSFLGVFIGIISFIFIVLGIIVFLGFNNLVLFFIKRKINKKLNTKQEIKNPNYIDVEVIENRK